MTPKEALNLASRKVHAGQLAEAEAEYRRLIAEHPAHAEAHNELGNLLCSQGRFQEGAECYRRALAACPIYAAALTNLGNALRLLGDLDRAAAAHQKALAITPHSAPVLFNLGLVYQSQRRFAQAIECFNAAISINPSHMLATANLGSSLEQSGRRVEAIEAYRRAVALDPNNASARCNLGALLLFGSRIEESLLHCRRAIELDPHIAEAHANLGNALWQAGRIELAIDSFRRASGLAPNNSAFLSNCSYTWHFDPQTDWADLHRINNLWNQRFADPPRNSIQPFENNRDPDRRLRVGYVSPHFLAHAEAAFMVPLLENHDREAVELYCYSDVTAPDAVTGRFLRRADVWRSTVGMSDPEVAAQIRADGIDILIDLTLHMNGTRLPVFALKPAPIQVAYLAYPGTTGLATMNYRFTDAFVDPPGMFDEHYTEKCIRLPRTFACYDPAIMPESVLPSPSQFSLDIPRPISFGSLNNFAKVNDRVLELWSRVLNALPQSRLRLLAPAEEGRRHVTACLSALGVEPRRIDFVSKQQRPEYLKEYHHIDICLDTLPYNGHTTTLDAIWMGVPVITRIGTTASGRVGWSVLNNLQLTELAANDDDEFVRIAVQLANNRPRLAELHATLRQRLTHSPIMDGPAFARDVEAAYRRMWHQWVQS